MAPGAPVAAHLLHPAHGLWVGLSDRSAPFLESLGRPGDRSRGAVIAGDHAALRSEEKLMDDSVPFFRPDIGQAEIDEVVGVLRSGWLTTGPKARRLEQEFAAAVGAPIRRRRELVHRRAAPGRRGPGAAAGRRGARSDDDLRGDRGGRSLPRGDPDPRGLRPGHAEHGSGRRLPEGRCARRGQAAGAGPGAAAARRDDPGARRRPHDGRRGRRALGAGPRGSGSSRTPPTRSQPPGAARRRLAWQRCGEETVGVSCFSFYANKTITTGEGGMAITADQALADRMRMMSLHGLSQDAWGRYEKGGELGLPDHGAGLQVQPDRRRGGAGHPPARARGVHAAGARRPSRGGIGKRSPTSRSSSCRRTTRTGSIPGTSSPSGCDRPARRRAQRLPRRAEGRGRRMLGALAAAASPSPTTRRASAGRPEDFPAATSVWKRLVSLPIFPSQTEEEILRVVGTVKRLLARHRKRVAAPAGVGC